MEIPTKATQVIQLPALLCVVAIFIYLFSYISYRTRGKLPWARFLAYIFAIFGIVTGFQQLWNMLNPSTGFIYRESVEKYPKIFYAHYFAPAVPAILFIVLLILDLRLRKVAKAEKLDDDDF